MEEVEEVEEVRDEVDWVWELDERRVGIVTRERDAMLP